ncbi:hypothetical protein GCM10007977_101090 [Dactylosporangium sucinum]|uniref:Uncharacterized protein n=1 Tax=Dactylosporangium sucinum TaxID=1424081 RepID=A0A917UDV0_9ACTN|nr:hypothetical protein GCM10007977_101090 [Dactylosporangium sucinum]
MDVAQAVQRPGLAAWPAESPAQRQLLLMVIGGRLVAAPALLDGAEARQDARFADRVTDLPVQGQGTLSGVPVHRVPPAFALLVAFPAGPVRPAATGGDPLQVYGASAAGARPPQTAVSPTAICSVAEVINRDILLR